MENIETKPLRMPLLGAKLIFTIKTKGPIILFSLYVALIKVFNRHNTPEQYRWRKKEGRDPENPPCPFLKLTLIKWHSLVSEYFFQDCKNKFTSYEAALLDYFLKKRSIII